MGNRGVKNKTRDWGSITPKGYVRGYDPDQGRQRFEHVLVWERENGEIPEGYQIHHIDGNKQNNDLSNLEIVDALTHKRLHGGCYLDESENWIKPCTHCGEYKSIENEFYVRDDGISSWCKKCCVENAVYNKRKRKGLFDKTE